MRALKNFFADLIGSEQSAKVDALHYFVTETSSREKKKVLRIIVEQVNKDQKVMVEKARKLSPAK